jgi:osmotically-inducible protein OsmY
MRTYNQQIEDAYAASKRQGDMMRDRAIEQSSGQDRRNRYRDDQFTNSQGGRSFGEQNVYDDQRTDRYGYERSSIYSNRNVDGDSNGSHRGKGPKNYRRSDERIREEIQDRLTDDEHIDASNIEVEVKAGEITLMGLVDQRSSKRRAEDIAESISGVTHVENRLKVQPRQ